MSVPEEVIVFLLAAAPISEVRGAIPVALHSFGMSVPSALFWAILGNLAPVVFLLSWLDPVQRWLSRRSSLFSRLFQWLFERTRRNHGHRFSSWGAIALISFVAIPLPVTGAWTGSVAAYVFGIPSKTAFPLIALGVVIASGLVTLLSLGAVPVLSFLLS